MRSIESIIDRQLRRWELQKSLAERAPEELPPPKPVITVSRELGANGEEIARRLARLSRFHLFDREILDAIAKDFGVRDRMVELLDEKTQSELESWFLGMITGRIIDQSDYVLSLTRIVGSLVNFGDAILVGRGTNIIVGPTRGFHLRIVGAKTKRAANISARLNIPLKEAERMIEQNDDMRAHFVKKSFGADINNPALYDLIINTDAITIDDAVDLAFAAYVKKVRALARS
jgi:hypothetical protein